MCCQASGSGLLDQVPSQNMAGYLTVEAGGVSARLLAVWCAYTTAQDRLKSVAQAGTAHVHEQGQ